MKKERAAGLFVCLVLLAGLQIPRFLGFPEFAVPLLPQVLWATASGQSWDSTCPRSKDNRRPDPALAFVCAAWPQVGAIYNEIKIGTADFAPAGDSGRMAAKDHPRKRGAFLGRLLRRK
jgi:hypothetical protein